MLDDYLKIRNDFIELDKDNLIDLVFIKNYAVEKLSGGYEHLYYKGDIVKGVKLENGDYRFIGKTHVTYFYKSSNTVMSLIEWNSLTEEEQRKIVIFDWSYKEIKNKLNGKTI